MAEAATAMGPGAGAAIRVLDKYEVIRRVAQGGMGEIFLARQVGVAGFNRLVILKTLLPELAEQSDVLEQFLDEARIGATLNHPNIVGIHEIGHWEGVFFLVMEFIDGDTLAGLQRAAAKKKASIPWVVSAQVVRDTARGLDHAHFATDPTTGKPLNIIHRDVTPQNIMVRLDGVVKVVDFGIAKAAGSDPRTNAGEVKGKLSYLSPEQISGATATVDHRADQFALGIVLWELCTGRRLFNQKNPLDIFKRILSHDIAPPTSLVPQVPQQLEKVVMRMLAQDPADRYPRCADAARDLQVWLDSLPGRVDATSSFVDRLIGDDARARLADLTPQPVAIQGLKRSAVASPCAVCKAPLPPRAKFCTECGTPTEHSGKVARSSSSMTPSRATRIEAGFGGADAAVPASVDELLGEKRAPAPSSEPVIVESFRRSGTHTPSAPVRMPTPAAATPTARPATPAAATALPSTGTPPAPTPRPTTQPRLPGLNAFAAASTEVIAAPSASTPSSSPSRTPPPTALTTMPSPSAAAPSRARTPPPIMVPIEALSASATTETHPVAPAPGLHRVVTEAGFAPPTPGSGAVSPNAGAPPSLVAAAPASPRVIEAAPSASSTMSMDDLFAVPGPTAKRAPTPPPRRALRPLFGRDAELARVAQFFAEASTRSRGLVFLGEAGVGKTALLERFAAAAEAAGLRAVVAQGTARGLAAPLDVIEQLLAGIAGSSDPAAIRRVVEQSGLPAPTVRRCLSALFGDPAPTALSGPLDHLLTESSLAKLLAALAAQRPVAWCIDDMHEASIPSLRVLGALQAVPAPGSIILGTADLRFDHPSLPLAELPPLGPESMGQALAASVNAIAIAPDVLQRVLERAPRNPAFACELMQYLVAEGGVVVDGGMVTPTPSLGRIGLPPNAGFHTTTRARSLGNATFDLLKAAASIGMGFTLGEIGNAAARATNPADAADRAVKDGLLVKESGDRYRFRRNTFFHVVARERRPGEIPDLHARLAAVSAGRPGAAKLAQVRHLLLAGEPRVDLVHELVATLRARGLVGVLENTLPAAVLTAVERVSGGAGDTGGLAVLAAYALEVLAPTSTTEALALADRVSSALAVLPVDDVAHAKFLRARAEIELEQGQLAAAERSLDKALELARRDRALAGDLQVALAGLLEKKGDLQGAALQYAEALKTSSGTLENRWRGGAELAAVMAKLGQADRARQLLAEAQLAAHEAGSAFGAMRCRLREASLLSELGQTPDALRLLETALRAAVDGADALAEAQVHREIAQVHARAGDPRQGIDHIQRAAELAKQVGWSKGVVDILSELRAFGRSGLM